MLTRLLELRREPRMIIALVLIAFALFVVIRVGSEFSEGESFAFDKWMLLALRHPNDLSQPIGPSWFKPVFVDITGLGSTTALTIFTLITVGYFLAARKVGAALFLALATGGGAVLGKVLKVSFSRPRPDIVPHFIDVHTASFPSGHTVNSAIVYLTIGAILSRAQPSPGLNVYIMSVAFTLAVLVGVSRVYLGVHYPTDVLAGWAVGGTWALLCWTTARTLHGDGSISMASSAQPPSL